ncbi:MAG: hypothetical protein GYA18_10380 [Chloroflexi bacterium]|nr:hypothetical protein [Chloroflexota bacterium]
MHQLRKLVIFIAIILLDAALIGSCTDASIKSIPLSNAYPAATRLYISSHYLPYDFRFAEEKRYAGLPLVTAISPDGMANLQLLGEEDDIQSARILIYLPIDADYEFANQQYTYFGLLLNSILGDDAGMDEWLVDATNSIAERSNTSLMGGAIASTPYSTDAGDLAVNMYVRLDEDENGFIMALVVGDWLDDIGYDPAHSVWQP